MNKLIYLWLAVKTVFCTCQPDHRTNDFKKVKRHYKISKIGQLPAVASESSGLAKGIQPGTFWTHNDSGGKPELYLFDLNGKLLDTKPVPNARNTDWEDLTQDNAGNFYIGDFGNNTSHRSILSIYKFNPDLNSTERIDFRYQSPASLSDCESFFYRQGSLYLFSKNWGKDHWVKMYRLPANQGDYTIAATDSIRINAQITSAALSPDGKTFALLTYGKVLLFETSGDNVDFSKPKGCFRFSRKQSEAIVFLNNTDMLMTNEQGSIYQTTFR
ncbi:esterase-like activity of phytase family protein [Dyadobacter sp. CY261]|uniref:esterase-like activity of phytase family protein n=1 Tax=Dyadobacter sp. CY261 TaxID=2907203 RepID=UPI001F396FFC|nr:esterase-like activity of phytase family protein [Dyadobacter sp. CY261]MCF0072495.1 esterase-like activity of phytase family protein [Dyadobacter sp. CY261]